MDFGTKLVDVDVGGKENMFRDFSFRFHSIMDERERKAYK